MFVTTVTINEITFATGLIFKQLHPGIAPGLIFFLILSGMKTKREESIQDILTSFEEMADIILGQLKLLERFMRQGNPQELETLRIEIREKENEIDRYEVLISEKFINSIVLYQPVASDIRKIIAVYRMTINLERIGDLVINIIDSIDNIKNTGEYQAMIEVLNVMLLSGMSMVEKSLLSFINNDNEYAIWTIKNDEIVDDMNRKLLKNSISKSKASEKTKEMLLSYIDLKNIITNLERIADHATNIAEASIYSIQGTDIRHAGLNPNQEITGENK
jgi:phosphate transport system protein